eukprot:SAG22_NODE_219_length_14877_cov_14.334619_10_plen_504_part_00
MLLLLLALALAHSQATAPESFTLLFPGQGEKLGLRWKKNKLPLQLTDVEAGGWAERAAAAAASGLRPEAGMVLASAGGVPLAEGGYRAQLELLKTKLAQATPERPLALGFTVDVSAFLSRADAALNAREYQEATRLYRAGLAATDDAPYVHADQLLGLARSLSKLGKYEAALGELSGLRAAMATAPSIAGIAAAMQRVECTLLLEEAAVLSCANRLDDAIEKQQQSLLLADMLADAGHGGGNVAGDAEPLVSERDITARMLELARLYAWVGRHEDSTALIEQAMPRGNYSSNLQWPTRNFDPQLKSKPWWSGREYSPYPGIAQLVLAAERAFPRLRAEYVAVAKGPGGELKRQNECLHDPTKGDWSYLPAYGTDRVAAIEAGACNRATPVACSLLPLLRMQAPDLVIKRIGYSAVEAGSHIRPHCGVTNYNLKLHLGLVVPAHPAAGCVTFTIGGEKKPFVQGKALVFDDSFVHEVTNRCESERVVLQVVFEHPARTAAAQGG